MSSGIGVIIAGAVVESGLGGRTTRARRSIGPIVANITVEEKHLDEMEITDHPIEQGAPVTDHVYRRPATLTLRCSWSNSISASTGLLGGIGQALSQKLSGALQNAATAGAQRAIGGSALGNLATGKLGALVGDKLSSFGVSVNSGKGKGTSAVQDVYQQLLKLLNDAVPFDVYTGKRTYKQMLISSLSVETDVRTENSLMATINCRQLIIVQTRVLSVTADQAQQRSPERTSPPSDEGTKQLVPRAATAQLQGLLSRATGSSP